MYCVFLFEGKLVVLFSIFVFVVFKFVIIVVLGVISRLIYFDEDILLVIIYLFLWFKYLLWYLFCLFGVLSYVKSCFKMLKYFNILCFRKSDEYYILNMF